MLFIIVRVYEQKSKPKMRPMPIYMPVSAISLDTSVDLTVKEQSNLALCLNFEVYIEWKIGMSSKY